MANRELLEKAAKAAGVPVVEIDDEGKFWVVGEIQSSWIEWNPLTDDGDALRLAVKLGIDIHTMFWRYSIRSERDPFVRTIVDRLGRSFAEQVVGDDPYAATRRAIVRAAAAIGESS